MTTTSVEKPHHVDETRMRHISDADLAATFGLASLADVRALLSSPERPRPVWDPVRWAAAKPASAPTVLAEADALLVREVDFLDRGLGRSRLYGFHYLGWLNPLIQAGALTGDPQYAACFERFFGQWYDCRDDVVGDWPGLDVIWYSLGVASRSAVFVKALAVFGSQLSEPRWAQLVKSIVGGARWAYEEHDAFRHGNWQLFSVAELLHVASVFPQAREAAAWVGRAQERLLDHLEHDFYADGGHHERSPGYHTMCLEALHRAAVVGEQQLGWDLAADERFRAAHDWLAKLADDAGWIPHLQDSGVVWPAKLLLRGDYFHPGHGFGELARRWLTPDEIAEELSWLPPSPPRLSAANAAERGSELLATSRYAVFRGANTQTVVNYGPHVGHELESHSHHAALDFVISADGVPVAWEAGCPPSYDDPGYYDWYQATRGHNTIEPPGVQLSTARTVVLDTFRTLPQLDVFAGHHDGYPVRHDRRIVFVRAEPHYWLISDVLGQSGFVWRMHGLAPWSEHEQGHRTAGMLAIPADPAGVEHTSGPARIPDPANRQADYGTIHGLHLTFAGDRSDVLLVPSSAGPLPATLSRLGQTLVVRIGRFEDHLTATTWARFDAETGSLIEDAQWS
ncbi:heparinase II/III family protein [Hamadaea sp. NPDC051192]|uniref:heparinase II/III domain-containing protein n=1 Tax=Hamadaea sp. NPDC051192 TaxID=3154940 RepID=UPI00341DC13E